jgi:ABC-type proline/glycine betaine transport system substrate-binding protein
LAARADEFGIGSWAGQPPRAGGTRLNAQDLKKDRQSLRFREFHAAIDSTITAVKVGEPISYWFGAAR